MALHTLLSRKYRLCRKKCEDGSHYHRNVNVFILKTKSFELKIKYVWHFYSHQYAPDITFKRRRLKYITRIYVLT